MQLSPISPTSQKPTIRFGSVDAPTKGALTGWVGGVDKIFRGIGASRGREMIVEDLFGFGVLRTGMDLLRGYFFGNGKLNIPAAGERLFRESTSIFTDNVLSGLAAKGVGNVYDKSGQSFSSQFVDYPTLELFKKTIDQGGTRTEAQFLSAIRDNIAPNNKTVLDTLQSIWNTPKKDLTSETLTQAATKIAKALKQDSYDIRIGKKSFQLENLLQDLNILKTHLDSPAAKQALKGSHWGEKAEQAINKTLTGKNWMLGCIALGMASTFAMPFLNVAVTKLMYGMNYYPGEMGLRKDESKPKQVQSGWPAAPAQKPSFAERHFPYVSKSLKDGKLLPLLLTLAPLPFAFGVFDTAAMRFLNPLKKDWLKHAKTGITEALQQKNPAALSKLIPFNKKVRNLFDFSKRAPYTAQQQMASIFALLITSRLLCARGDNEFRERLVDSFAGWGLWILGTPLIKKGVAKYLDGTAHQAGQNPVNYTKLLKNGTTLRSRAEIENLLEASLLKNKAITKEMAQAIKQKTLKAHILLGAGSTIVSMLLLGIVEPWVGIQWTKHNERKKQAEAAQRNQAATPARPPLPMPRPLQTGVISAQPAFQPISGNPISQQALSPFPGKFPTSAFSTQQSWPMPLPRQNRFIP